MYDVPAKTSDKSKDLVSVLQSHLGGKTNLARIKLISHFIKVLCIVQTVTFDKPLELFYENSRLLNREPAIIHNKSSIYLPNKLLPD
jgi:hypothetical protein